MIRLTAAHLAIFIVLDLLKQQSIAQPTARTQWQQISTSKVDLSDSPRVAKFSDSGYVVVYTISGTPSSAVMSLFGPDGTNLLQELKLSDSGSSTALPRVIVFSDDTFMTAWKDLTANEIHARLWNRNGTNTSAYLVSLSSVPPSIKVDSFEIALMTNDSWWVAYSSESFVNLLWFENKGFSASGVYTLDAVSAHLSIVPSFTENKLYLAYEDTLGLYDFPVYKIYTPFGYNRTFATFNDAVPLKPFTVITSSGIVVTLWQSELNGGSIPSSIGLTAIQSNFSISSSFTIVNDNRQNDGAVNPFALDIGNDRLLVTYEGTYLGTTRPIYRMVYVSPTDPVAKTAPSGTEVFEYEAIRGIRMTQYIGSEIVVVANNISSGGVVRKVLTFCGNGALELNEQCDGTESCSSTCQCERGTVALNGFCVPVCGDGLVVGSEQCDSSEDSSCDSTNCVCVEGYIPASPRRNSCDLKPETYIPSVSPTLDCISLSEVPVAYFSFLNEDGFAQSIHHGYLNQFIPDTIGLDRPTYFEAGASLTYPASPYKVELPLDATSFTWILGQYNLTVDLTNITALLCPPDGSFVVKMVTSDLLSNQLIQTLSNNFATRYGVADTRLTTDILLYNQRTTLQDTTLYNYSLTVIVAAPNTTDEVSSEQVLSDFLTEYKNETSQREVEQDLTQGLEPVNPQIKEVTPAPTGVSVRGTRYDVPPMAQPVTFTPPVSPPNLSSGSKICYSSLFCLVLVLALM